VKLLGLDISTKAGWAVLQSAESGLPALGAYGLVEKTKKNVLEYGSYPECYRRAAKDVADQLLAVVREHCPDVVIVEETNQGQNRYTQKLLEFIHKELGDGWDTGNAGHMKEFPCTVEADGKHRHQRLVMPKIVYISTGTWKQALGLKKPKDAKKNDELLKQAKMLAATGTVTLNEAKKRYGIKGKWNKKMLAVNYTNENYGLTFKLKDNDKAEAICLVVAYTKGAKLCDGDPNPKHDEE
jgi:hypothetical protein